MSVIAIPKRRSWRWLRAAVPFAVLAVIWLGVSIAHAIEEPDLADPGTLSPTGTGAHGSSQLAEMLRSRGVTVDRVTSGAQALGAVFGPPSTVFVPTPDYLDPAFINDIEKSATIRRVVVVQPGLRSAILGPLPVFPVGDSWVTAVVPPDCDEPSLPTGPAAAHDTTYDVDPQYASTSCYQGSVVTVRSGGTETVYVGANDPFRNNRINEVGNAALATALLGGNDRVIWVDVHKAEPVQAPPLPGIKLPQYRRDNQDRTDTGFPVFDAFPSWLWAGLLLALAGTVLLALARARRLGPPVPEPLPVIVPASESVTGRGRLYERIAAREATLEALRGAAIRRIAPALNPFGGPPPGSAAFDADLGRFGAGGDRLVRQVAQRTGSSEIGIRAILYGAPPADDAGLGRAVAELDALVAAVLNPRQPAPQGTHSPVTSTQPPSQHAPPDGGTP